MDAPCKIQGSIHVFRLVNNMCPGKWVHINIEPFCKTYKTLKILLDLLAFEVCRQHSTNYFFQFAIGKVWAFVEC